MLTVYLNPGRDKPVRNGHPWVFSGAIDRVEGAAASGDPCRVASADGTILGHGYYNAASSIRVRLLTKGDVAFCPELLGERIGRAVAARSGILDEETDSCRLVNAEGDFLPGLVVDRYGRGLCIQILTSGMERMRALILAKLQAVLAPAFIFERSDAASRQREGLGAADGLLAGSFGGPVVVRENGLDIGVDLAGGQKTGYYFDQRENRLLSRRYAGGARCLDCFSYSGAFSLNLLAGGAESVTMVDSSKHALAWAAKSVIRNGYDASRVDSRCADAFDFLRQTTDRYGCVILDPPKFAPRRADVDRAARGYKDINRCAMKVMSPGGVFFTFSCSNAVDQRLFRQIVFAAAADAGRPVQLLHVLAAGPDHPVDIAHPEGEYLKGLVLRVW